MSVGTTCLNGMHARITDLQRFTDCGADMFFMHERGAKSGVYTIFITNGAHIAILCTTSRLALR